MHIAEHTEQRLILQHRRGGVALGLAVFSLLSAFAAGITLLQGITRFVSMAPFERLSWMIFVALTAGLAVAGAVSWTDFGRGLRCIFDRSTETVTIQRPRLLRPASRQFSIYSVSHLHVQRSEEARVYGLFLVLRSGERVPLTTVPPFDAEQAHAIARTVRGFLQAAPPG